MLHLQLLELVQKQFPNLDFDKKSDLIRLEKVLKAEAKLNPTIKVNDLEKLFAHLKLYGGKFLPLLNDKNITIILKAEKENLDSSVIDVSTFSEEVLLSFQDEFSGDTLNYLTACLKANDWKNLTVVFVNYSFMISDVHADEIYRKLHFKIQAVKTAVHQHRYAAFIGKNPYAIDRKFYALLSTINEYYFEDDVTNLNNLIVSVQPNSRGNLNKLGKILYALTYFESGSSNLSETLATNRDVALKWAYPYTGLFRGELKLSKILQIIAVLVLIFGAVILVPTSAGAAIGLAIFIVRLILALTNNKTQR